MTNAKKKSSGWRPWAKRRTPKESQARRVAVRVAQARRDCARLRLWRDCPAKRCLRLRRCAGDPSQCKEHRPAKIAEQRAPDMRAQIPAAPVPPATARTAPAAPPPSAPPRPAVVATKAPPRFAMSAAEAAAAIAASIANNTDDRFLSGDDLEAIMRGDSIHRALRWRR